LKRFFELENTTEEAARPRSKVEDASKNEGARRKEKLNTKYHELVAS